MSTKPRRTGQQSRQFQTLPKPKFNRLNIMTERFNLVLKWQTALLQFPLFLLSGKASVVENNVFTGEVMPQKIKHTPCRTFCQQNEATPRRGWASSARRRRNTTEGALYLRHRNGERWHYEEQIYSGYCSQLSHKNCNLKLMLLDQHSKIDPLKESLITCIWLHNSIFNLITDLKTLGTHFFHLHCK